MKRPMTFTNKSLASVLLAGWLILPAAAEPLIVTNLRGSGAEVRLGNKEQSKPLGLLFKVKDGDGIQLKEDASVTLTSPASGARYQVMGPASFQISPSAKYGLQSATPLKVMVTPGRLATNIKPVALSASMAGELIRANSGDFLLFQAGRTISSTVEWTTQPNCTGYRVELLDSNGSKLWSAESAKTSQKLPLEPGRKYQVRLVGVKQHEMLDKTEDGASITYPIELLKTDEATKFESQIRVLSGLKPNTLSSDHLVAISQLLEAGLYGSVLPVLENQTEVVGVAELSNRIQRAIYSQRIAP